LVTEIGGCALAPALQWTRNEGEPDSASAVSTFSHSAIRTLHRCHEIAVPKRGDRAMGGQGANRENAQSERDVRGAVNSSASSADPRERQEWTLSMNANQKMNKSEFDPSLLPPNPYLLLTPGPLSTSPAVRASMVRDWCTWDDEYNAITREIRSRLETLADSENRYAAVPLQGSGTFAVEAMIGGAVPRDGKILVLSNGAYGDRAARIAKTLGIPTVVHQTGELAPSDPSAVDEILEQDSGITHVLVVHVETTTGIVNPIEVVAAVARSRGRAVLVDAMSSFGGVPFDAGAMELEAFATSANKCLQGVPGIGLVFVDKKCLPAWEGRARSLSLDVFDQWREMENNQGKWRFTSPTHVVRAFLQALRELQDEGGIAKRNQRLRENQLRLVAGFRKLGFQTVLPDILHSPVITSFLSGTVAGFSFPEFYKSLKAEGFVLYPGKIGNLDSFRVGSIGHVFPTDMDRLVEAARRILSGVAGSTGSVVSTENVNPGIQAVLLDWAGTAVDYGCQAPVEVFVDAMSKRGIEVSREQARGPMGVAKLDHVKAILALDPVRIQWNDRYGRLPDDTDAQAIHDGLEETMVETAARHAELIPGHLDLVAWLRSRSIAIATGSGYTRRMMEPVLEAAKAQGYVPDSVVLPQDVGAGRPSPLMAYQSAVRIGRSPLTHFVKIGDTPADMREGRNAGCWSVGYSRCGNEFGYTRQEDAALESAERERLLGIAASRLKEAGAHYVVEGPWEVVPVLEEIEARLRAGERP